MNKLWLFYTVFLMLLAFIVGVLFGIGDLILHAKDTATGFIYNYQTLIAGMIALAGALVTVRQMRKQQEEEHKAKQRAALVTFSDTLSTICSFALEGMKSAALERVNPLEINVSLDREALLELKEVATLYEGPVSVVAAEIGKQYQLCRARSRNVTGPRLGVNRIGVVWDYATLYCYASRLFDFARGEDTFPPTIQTEITSEHTCEGTQNVLGKPNVDDIHRAIRSSHIVFYHWLEEEEVRKFFDLRQGIEASRIPVPTA